MKTPEEFIAAIMNYGRVCPQSDKWNELRNLLPDRRRSGNGWEPSMPLILSAWHHSSNTDKRERLLLHLKWAESHGKLETVITFLESLSPNEWHSSYETSH